jgi:gamma-glutamyltranspeptidase/glutathione hydrolase
MGSMMAPTVAADTDGLVLAAGAAGASRITSALTQVLAGVLAEGADPADAIERPRLHRVGDAVMVEPDFEDAGVEALRGAGYDVRRFATRHHFFGAVSAIGRTGAGADTRRDGAVRLTASR